jgi:protein-L-isoaspartate(D-aspartate) O-methyltransferase
VLAAVLSTAMLARAQANPLISDPWAPQRSDMVENQLRKQGIKEPSILTAMRDVPRHLFVPESRQAQAYAEAPVEFAPGQALPQAFLSALMIELLDLDRHDKVLEIGTGSGYDAAVLSRLVRRVYTIEIDPAVGQQARRTLDRLGYDNVQVRIGDGYRGWPEEAPFDAILVTAAPDHVPDHLLEQLKVGGKMVVAVGSRMVQDLTVVTKTPDGPEKRKISPVVMTPMIEPQDD